MKRRIWSIAILTLVAVVLVVPLANSYWETLPYATYRIGEEIKGFPTDGTSIIINNFSISPDITFPETSEDVIFNVTIKSTENFSIYFNQSDLQPRSDQSGNKYLDLKYETKNVDGETSPWNYANSWGISIFGVQGNGFDGLSPNESLQGSIRYVLGNDNYTAFQLVCRSSSEQKPQFIVNLAS